MATYITNSILDGEKLPFAAEGSAANQLETNLSQPYNAWKQTDTPQTRRDVLKAVQPVLDRTVASYGDHPYIRGQAKKLALEALQTYDPQKGKLQSHVQSSLRGLQRLTAQQNQIISVPERIMLDRQFLRNAETELEDRLGRPPNIDEIANHTGLAPKRIGYIRGVVPATAAGSIRGEAGEPVDVASQSLSRQQGSSLWERLVYDDLSDRDKLIYDYTLGTHGTQKLSASQLAAKLGVTSAAISQRRAMIQEKLDQEILMGMGE